MINPVVLVTEDDAPVRNLIVTTLKTHDYRYLTAKNGTEAIMMASSYNPDVLFLDEPTIGIDVLSKERIRHFIKKINEERHTTIILTTHDVSDIESLCEKMIIIDKGSLIYDGTLPQLKSDYRTTDLEEIIKKIYLAGEKRYEKIC